MDQDSFLVQKCNDYYDENGKMYQKISLVSISAVKSGQFDQTLQLLKFKNIADKMFKQH